VHGGGITQRERALCGRGKCPTVTEVDGSVFGVNLVPHRSEVSTLGGPSVGSSVTIRMDVIARYVEHLVKGLSSERSLL
jgi:riboflavin synthase